MDFGGEEQRLSLFSRREEGIVDGERRREGRELGGGQGALAAAEGVGWRWGEGEQDRVGGGCCCG